MPQRPDSLIVISAHREDEELVLRVADNGRGLTGRVLREGVGVANTRKRLDHLYPRRSSFRMEPGTPNGWVVTTRLPYRIAAVVERCERVLA